MTIVKRIIGLITGIMSVTYFVMSASQGIVMIILGLIFAVITVLLFKPTKKDKEKKIQKKEKRNESLNTCTMKHINGLPIAEDVYCTVQSLEDKFIFSAGTLNFELEKHKITDMCIKTDKEIQQQYVSSVGGAIGGAVLFGPLGAMIGGRAKKKTTKNEVHNYLIITYQSSNEIKYIGFEIQNSIASAYKYVRDFRNAHAEETTYQL